MAEEEESLVSAHTVVTNMRQHKRSDQASGAFLIIIYGEQLGLKIPLDTQPLAIGRSADNDIQVEQESVSRRHCRIEFRAREYQLADLQSTNGTFVNDLPIDNNRVSLRDGDQIKVGQTLFKFIMGDNVEAQYHEEIYRLMTVDALTNVYNKRYYREALDKEVGRSQRYGRQMALLIFDIDHFKKINDGFGHLAGDAILARIGSLLQEHLRHHDMAARIGGEEFAVILPEVGLEGAKIVADKLLRLVAQTKFDFEGELINVTISIGVAEWTATSTDTEDIMKRADAKLYEAKNSGRNRVCY